MDQKVLKVDDLNPDGLRITVNWENMDVSSSVFVPCVNTEKCKEQLKKLAERKNWELDMQVRIEDGKLGLRTWRTV
ncbi:MAG: hypothetical protein CMJ25_28480 [Phycisphaerae bacterium]|nr:hypothetical protein [Phycisphaerae bacterium]|tara:strand:- start:4 stop:231 length:228 start_codon:yes stop_codon:yes gene_type:complete